MNYIKLLIIYLIVKYLDKLEKNKKKLKANFHSISDNGKKITYLMDKPSIKLLNPGDGSMNGSFNYLQQIFFIYLWN